MQERCFAPLLFSLSPGARWGRHVLPLLLTYSIFLLLLCSAASAQVQVKSPADSTLKVSLDFPYFGEGRKLIQDIYFSAPQKASGTLQFSCYKYSGRKGDSLFVYGRKNVPFKIKPGASTVAIKFGPNDATSSVLAPFYHTGVTQRGLNSGSGSE